MLGALELQRRRSALLQAGGVLTAGMTRAGMCPNRQTAQAGAEPDQQKQHPDCDDMPQDGHYADEKSKSAAIRLTRRQVADFTDCHRPPPSYGPPLLGDLTQSLTALVECTADAMEEPWRSYDSVASTHGRLSAPSIFAQPANDLVTRIGMSGAGTILDVGTGTGIAASMALKAAAPGTIVVGADPSLAMLRAAPGAERLRLAAAALPDLPFSAATFDRVLANFVINHVASYKDALRDMVRVLRRGGKLGITTWGAMENEFRQYWQTVAERFVSKEELRAAVEVAIPWEDWFHDPSRLRQAFLEARLMDIEIHREFYTTRMPIADFLAIRETSIQARFMRQAMDGQRWEAFRQTVSTEFHQKFKEPLEHARDVHITIGNKHH